MENQESLRMSEERFRIAVENATDLVWEWDFESGILDWFGDIDSMLGYEPGVFPRTVDAWEKTIHPDDAVRVVKSLDRHLRSHEPYSESYRVICKDGSIKYWLDKGSVLPEKDGSSRKMVGVVSDVTEHTLTEEILRESEERFRIIFERSTIGKSLTAPDGRLLKINQAFADMLGYSVEEMQHLNFANVTHPDDIAESREGIRCLLADEQTSYRMEKRYIHKSGRLVWADVSTTLLKDKNGNPLYLITSITDITERKLAEDELRKNFEELRKTQQTLTKIQNELIRSEKLAVLGKLSGGVGHELRNPLGAIKNGAYFLNMAIENPDDEVKEVIDMINSEVNRSEDIISSLLDFARPKPPVRAPVQIHEVIKEVLKRFPLPEHITFQNTINNTLPVIQADFNKLIQVFGNLVSNAYQAMPENGTLTLSTQESPGWISVSVTDTGVGISRENMKNLFEPLFTTKTKGIGLGLVVIQTIVQSHGGKIEVMSEEGIGTTFTVLLPITGDEINEPRSGNAG